MMRLIKEAVYLILILDETVVIINHDRIIFSLL